MISDVASVPSTTAAPVLPSDRVIELLRDIVFANISQMSTFTLPSMAAGAESQVLIAAEAVSANSGNAEKLMRAYEALKEALYLQQNRSTVPETRIASYLDRVTRAACNFQQGAKLPQAGSFALAAAFKNGTTFTLDTIASAYNHNGGAPAVDVNGIVTAYNGILSSLNTALTTSAEIPDTTLVGIYASRGDLGSLTAGTLLQADQALVLLQAVQAPNQRCQAPLNYLGIIAELIGDTTLVSTPSFADIEVYHQRLQCPQQYPGSLEARIKVYAPQGTTVSGVTISADGMKNQSGQPLPSMNLTTDDFPSPGTSNWKLSGGATQACLAFGQTYTFTIAASLSSGNTLTTQVTSTVVDVPEARITLMAKDYSESGMVFNFAQGDNLLFDCLLEFWFNFISRVLDGSL